MESEVLLGTSPAIVTLLNEAGHVAATDSKVLITGESGVGKELLARYLHERSPRTRRPFVAINCAGLPEPLLESELFGHVRGSFTGAYRDRCGLFERASGGTVLLDEVGEMGMRMQALLLRFLENGEIQRVGSDRHRMIADVRIVAATNRDLIKRTREKEFRLDLYYRLNVVHLVVPPLRDRPGDVRLLFDHYLRVMSEIHRLPPCEASPECMASLEAYPWPGNVRELKNLAERLALRHPGRVLTPLQLPVEIVRRDPPQPVAGPDAAAPAVCPSPADRLARACFERMRTGGESFWTAVFEPFMKRDLTRATVRTVVRLGLEQTNGNYRVLTEAFNLPPADEHRFLSFLRKHDCRVPYQEFGRRAGTARQSGPPALVGAK